MAQEDEWTIVRMRRLQAKPFCPECHLFLGEHDDLTCSMRWVPDEPEQISHDVVMLGALATARECERCGAWRRFYQCLGCGVSLCRECGEEHKAKEGKTCVLSVQKQQPLSLRLSFGESGFTT